MRYGFNRREEPSDRAWVKGSGEGTSTSMSMSRSRIGREHAFDHRLFQEGRSHAGGDGLERKCYSLPDNGTMPDSGCFAKLADLDFDEVFMAVVCELDGLVGLIGAIDGYACD